MEGSRSLGGCRGPAGVSLYSLVIFWHGPGGFLNRVSIRSKINVLLCPLIMKTFCKWIWSFVFMPCSISEPPHGAELCYPSLTLPTQQLQRKCRLGVKAFKGLVHNIFKVFLSKCVILLHRLCVPLLKICRSLLRPACLSLQRPESTQVTTSDLCLDDPLSLASSSPIKPTYSLFCFLCLSHSVYRSSSSSSRDECVSFKHTSLVSQRFYEQGQTGHCFTISL